MIIRFLFVSRANPRISPFKSFSFGRASALPSVAGCSANTDTNGENNAIFFGLSGTGKTARSTAGRRGRRPLHRLFAGLCPCSGNKRRPRRGAHRAARRRIFRCAGGNGRPYGKPFGFAVIGGTRSPPLRRGFPVQHTACSAAYQAAWQRHCAGRLPALRVVWLSARGVRCPIDAAEYVQNARTNRVFHRFRTPVFGQFSQKSKNVKILSTFSDENESDIQNKLWRTQDRNTKGSSPRVPAAVFIILMNVS